MGECSICGETEHLARKCNYCGGVFCSKHTLPEKHNCPAVRASNNTGKRFESAFKDTLDESNGDTSTTNNVRKPSDLSVGPDKSTESKKNSKTDASREPFSGDSGPDVAPDGSLVEKDSRLDRELDRMREEAEYQRNWARRARRTLRTLWFRFFLAVTSFRVWIVILIAIASMGQLGYAPVPGLPVDQDTIDSVVGDASGFVANATQSEELNRTKIEQKVHREINERRQEKGLQPLEYDERLQTVARSHSKDMGQRQYFSHSSPEGETVEDRYQEHGYSCRVPTSRNRYTTGAENIAYTYAHERIEQNSGDTAYYTNEEEIAKGLVNQWMNSTGHRENILRPYWENEGIGIYITEIDGETRVYATQNFC